MDSKVCIIGCGPSGLFAGANLNGLSVTLFERNNECGIKLNITGSSKCNFTHSGDLEEFTNHYGKQKKKVYNSLKRYSRDNFLKYLDQKEYKYELREDGKYFPKSLSAKEFKEFLVEENKKLGNFINTNEMVKDINKIDNQFQVITDKNIYYFDYVIVATGGKSYPSTGSDGNFFSILKKLGHSINKLKPSLSPIYIEDFKLSNLMGISFKNVKIKNFRDGKKIGNFNGEILITHFGFSGPVILNNSRDFENGDNIKINFLEDINGNDIEKNIIESSVKLGKTTVSNFLKSLNLPKRFCDEIIKLSNIKSNQKLSELTKIQRKLIVSNLTSYSFIIKKVGDYNISMATAGGVKLKDVNTKNFESKILENFFIIGECLDVDGDTGGYNIQWAFTSAYLAANEINKRAVLIDN